MTDAELDAYVKTAEDEQASSGAVLALVSALREAKGLLWKVEWAAGGDGGPECPVCGRYQESPAGHRPGCALAEAIK